MINVIKIIFRNFKCSQHNLEIQDPHLTELRYIENII